MNEVIKNIKTRVSVKKFNSKPVEKALIEAIVSAGLKAPSGKNMQAPIIVAVTDKKTRDALSRANASILGIDKDPFYGAPAVLVVLARKDFFTHVYDGSLVMQNLMLAAHSLGVSSCWIHRARETFELPEWREWLSNLGVEGEYEGIGNCVLGYPDGEIPEPKEVREGRIFWVE